MHPSHLAATPSSSATKSFLSISPPLVAALPKSEKPLSTSGTYYRNVASALEMSLATLWQPLIIIHSTLNICKQYTTLYLVYISSFDLPQITQRYKDVKSCYLPFKVNAANLDTTTAKNITALNI